MELNGPPASMRAEDTYFVTSPGEPLKLPEVTTVVVPKEDAINARMKVKIVPYSSQLTYEDLQRLTKDWNHVFWGSYYRGERARNKYPHYDPTAEKHSFFFELWRYFHPSQFDTMQQYLEVHFRWRNQRFLEERRYNQQRQQPQSQEGGRFRLKGIPIVAQLINKEQPTALRQFILDALNTSSPELSMKEHDREQVLRKMEEDIRKYLCGMLKLLTVDQVITDLGYTVRNVDPYYLLELDDARNYPQYHSGQVEIPPFEQEVEALAQKMGTSTERHPYSKEADAEMIARALAGYQKKQWGHITKQESVERINTFRKELAALFPTLLPQSRRMYYLTGAY